MLGYDQYNTGHAGGESAPTTDVAARWTTLLDDDAGTPPVITNGSIYLGNRDETIRSYDVSTGDEEWVFDTGDIAVSPPAVVDGYVYAGSNDGWLYCLDADSGELEWEFDTGDAIGPRAPAVVEGRVYIGSDELICLDAADGDEIWRRDMGRPETPTVVDGTVYVGDSDYGLVAWDANTGDLEWAEATSPETEDGVDGAPAVTDTRVFAGGLDNTVYAFDRDDGDIDWSYPIDSEAYAAPTVADDTVFVGGNDNFVYALDPVDGDLLWSTEQPGQVLQSVTYADGVVLAGAIDRTCLTAMDASTGDILWQFTTEGDRDEGDLLEASPTLVDNDIVIATENWEDAQQAKLLRLTGGGEEPAQEPPGPPGVPSTDTQTPETRTRTPEPTRTRTPDSRNEGDDSTPRATPTATPTATPIATQSGGSGGDLPDGLANSVVSAIIGSLAALFGIKYFSGDSGSGGRDPGDRPNPKLKEEIRDRPVDDIEINEEQMTEEFGDRRD
ncbi:outer membrane protein assembly factor BamB family protein [Haloplanus natans]|uniref:outer membrane protein assembly factor BamB family protein n=1 Tax=Haloplanus natans TaxID=376171 RepID=UPI000677CEC7|nr:PQQ-binding-like beta-propeller repeat protein [Haloplanus natans]